MSELNDNLTEAVRQKNLYLLPENLKKDITVLGVTGTYTSDANATANDIVEDKTAYVNGQKITGTAKNFKGSGISLSIQISIGYLPNTIDIYQQFSLGYAMINNDTSFQGQIQYSDLASLLNVTADKIKKGVTILGITGTYEGSSWENVSSFTIDDVLSSDNQPPLVFVYEDENEVVSGSRIRIMNISSTDTLHVEFEGDESYDEMVLPGTTSINMFDANTQSSDMTPAYLSTVATFTWISPSL